MATPKKRCGNVMRHNEHEWYEDNVFRRQCPGRKTTRLRERGNGEGGNAG